ncbi:hypothetical protein [Pseudoclavibacter sp. RFBG4]|uniref:hypothetical protein n=1 Tax=Pseudoclavibacter sp. RFBG4 TaxID=2080575 RepID=UPI0011B07C11|nr:hypothetical protein [Pseudoclavibacter sp. RFBG4]
MPIDLTAEPGGERRPAEVETGSSSALVALCILTAAFPIAAVWWLLTGAASAVPTPNLFGSPHLPAWVVPLEPRSYLRMMASVAVLCLCALTALLLSGIARQVSTRLRALGADLQAGALITARIIARLSGIATFVLAALFLSGAAASVLWEGAAAESAVVEPAPSEEVVGGPPPQPTDAPVPPPVGDNGPIFSASATTAEREAAVRDLAELTLQHFPGDLEEIDYVGAPGMEISRQVCGGYSRSGDHYFVGHSFRTDAGAAELEQIEALWTEKGLNIGTTPSSISGDGLRSDTIENASLSYDTDGTFHLFITGRCGDIP